jgi:hypothetical protein
LRRNEPKFVDRRGVSSADCMAHALTPPFPNASTISAFKGRRLVSLTAHCAAVVIMGRRRRRRNDSINGFNTDAVDAPLRGCYPLSAGVKASKSTMSRDVLPGCTACLHSTALPTSSYQSVVHQKTKQTLGWGKQSLLLAGCSNARCKTESQTSQTPYYAAYGPPAWFGNAR